MMGIQEKPTINEAEKIVAGDELRGEADEHGIFAGGGCAGHLAGADDHEDDPAICLRCGLGGN